MLTRTLFSGFKFSEMEMSKYLFSCMRHRDIDRHAEVVLSVLVSNFTFELSNKPIAWNVGGVMYPTAGKESARPELPLKVGLYKHVASA